MKKKLHKSIDDKKISGVCGGIAEYFDIDSTIVRLICILLVFGLGTGLLAYIIAALIMDEGEDIDSEVISNKKAKKMYKSENKKISGVCGGIAEYFDIDPTVVRLIWIMGVLCFGVGLLAYIMAALIMPNKK